MAQIDLARYRALQPGQSAEIGHNRTCEVAADGDSVTFRLHGYPVVTFLSGNGYAHAVLDPCGYRTTTTRQAMRDFLQAALTGYAGVSFARGEFIASACGSVDFVPTGTGRLAAAVDPCVIDAGPVRNLVRPPLPA